MSRIRFEWNIESTKIDRSDGEDILAKRRRRRNVYILLFLICLLLATVAACGLFVRQRLIDVKNQYAQLLQDTVKAEVAALRIGDMNTFLNIQAEDEAWRNQQRGKYQDYSRLKAENEIDLTGNILSVELDDELARVLVQENIKDLPYARLWFYQREESRWRHIAPDYSLWGAWQIYESPGVRVNYREADALFAKQLGETVAAWIKTGCAIFACPDELRYVIDVLPEAADRVAWSDVAARRLLFRSPYTDLARADMPFEGGLQFRASQLIAGRFVDDITGTLVTATSYDANFLRESAVGWLAEQFTRIDSGALLIRSLADTYGVDRVRQLLSMLGEAGDMSIIRQVLPVPIERAELDWRDFIAWRLRLEDELISARAQDDWLRLYDTASKEARIAGYERYNLNVVPESYLVSEQVVWIEQDGTVQLRVTVDVVGAAGVEQEIVLFKLVDDVWKRAS